MDHNCDDADDRVISTMTNFTGTDAEVERQPRHEMIGGFARRTTKRLTARALWLRGIQDD
jgi:hypothetical protein